MPTRKPARIKRNEALVDRLFADATLAPGEDPLEYEALCVSFLDSLRPQSPVERVFVLDMVAKTWEIMRLQRYRRHVSNGARVDVIAALLKNSFGFVGPLMNIKQLWLDGDPSVVEALKTQLKRMKAGREYLEAQAFVAGMDTLDRIDQQILRLEQSRFRALRTIALLNEVLAKRAAGQMKTIEGEFHRSGSANPPPPANDQP